MIVKGNGNAIGGDVHIGLKMGVAETDCVLERERSIFWMSAGTPAMSERKRVSDSEVRVRHGGSVAIDVDTHADGALTDMRDRTSLRWRHGPLRRVCRLNVRQPRTTAA